MARDVKESNVLSRWGVLAVGQADKEAKFFKLVREELKTRGWPFDIEEVDVGSGWFGRRQKYLETEQDKLVAYIGAEAIGRDCYFGWSLTLYEPGLLKKAVAMAGGVPAAIFQVLDFNQANSARAFATSLNYAVQAAVDVVMDEAGLDVSKINREATGLLGSLI